MAKRIKPVRRRRLCAELMAGVDDMRQHREGRLTLKRHKVEPITLPSLEPKLVPETREALIWLVRKYPDTLDRLAALSVPA